jgi:RNA polymerase sigma-70 factor (ECF subfamily)
VQPALIDGKAGLVFAPGGRLSRALTFTVTNGRITEVEIITDRERLQQLDLSVLDN